MEIERLRTLCVWRAANIALTAASSLSLARSIVQSFARSL